jgi:site-specific DNA-methyltransferase (adenine-specific)
MSVQLINISELTVNPNNPRIIKDEKFDKLVQSIKEFPDMLKYRPIVVDENNVILGGNMRFKACKAAKLKQVHVMKASELTEAQKREFIIKDNVSGGEWDWAMLQNEWDTEQLDAWGVDIPNFEPEQELEAVEDDYEIPEEIQTDIVLGDLFEIGEHRLLCGDSTDSDAVARLMDGEKADMVFTDPPYKIQTEGGCNGITGEALKKQGKDIEFISNFNPSEFLQVLPIVFSKNMNAYIFCNKELLPDYLVWARDSGYSFNVLIWKKPNAIPIGDSHRPDIEYILLFRKSAIWNNALEGVNYSRCLEFGREKGLHPTMKPIELISNEMQISSNKGSLVFDFFLGSGSTMVASHQLKRKCYGIELDPKYCQVIVDRMIKLDPSLTIKRNGHPYLQRKNSDAKA